MAKKDSFENCCICHRHLKFEGIDTIDSEYKPKICAECNFYRKKTVQNVITAFIIAAIFFAIFLILPISKKIHFIVSLIMLCIALPSFVFVMILKIRSRHEKIEF